jgi:hypothetical protein
MSYYAANISSDAPSLQPTLAEDGNSITEIQNSPWSNAEGYVGSADPDNYLFEITFVKYTETDESGKNLWAKLAGPTLIGRNGADALTLVLDNESDVVAKSRNGALGILPQVNASVVKNGSPIDDVNIVLLETPTSFTEDTHYTYSGNRLVITGIPDDFD